MNIKQLLLTISIATSIVSSSTAIACQPPTTQDFLLITGFTAAWLTSVYLDAKYTKTLTKPENKPATLSPKQLAKNSKYSISH